MFQLTRFRHERRHHYPHFERTLEIFDTQGGAQPVRLSFLKTAANTWEFEAHYEGDPTNVTHRRRRTFRLRHHHL